MKILYVSDLDGTLLNKASKLSKYAIDLLNELIDNGICFSFATARSLPSFLEVANGLKINIPIIIYNGTFIINANTKEILFSCYFTNNEIEYIKELSKTYKLYPLVYTHINKSEKVLYLKGTENEGINNLLELRKDDKRYNYVNNMEELFHGDVFYFTFINAEEVLQNIYTEIEDKPEYTCTFQQELYRPEYWLELMPKAATKGNAILKLKEMLKCNKIITFGDAINDISMFRISDECYAVNNAVDELKKYSTGVINSNDEDGVAHWLEENCK
jgi:Cof subfamily protein (haloacid dehalogenase superfamily)